MLTVFSSLLYSSTVGEYDDDKRLAAYEKISPQLFSKIGETHTLLILSHSVYDMSSEDLSLRHSASSCLLSFIQFSAYALESEESMQEEEIQDGLKREKKTNHINIVDRGLLDSCISNGCGNWSKVSVKHVIYNFSCTCEEWHNEFRDIYPKGMGGFTAFNGT